MELTRQTRTAIDIAAAEAEVLSFRYTGTSPIEVISRVDLGDAITPIAGGGNYTLDVFLNAVPISPSSNIDVPAGRTKTILASRIFPLAAGDVVSIQVRGQSGDTGIDTVASLRDVTAAKAADLVSDGSVLVDQNYGGTDALTVMTAAQARIDAATILAYRAADYAGGKRQPSYVVGQTRTDVDGYWAEPLMLDPGAYTLLIYKQGVIRAKVVGLTVTAPG